MYTHTLVVVEDIAAAAHSPRATTCWLFMNFFFFFFRFSIFFFFFLWWLSLLRAIRSAPLSALIRQRETNTRIDLSPFAFDYFFFFPVQFFSSSSYFCLKTKIISIDILDAAKFFFLSWVWRRRFSFLLFKVKYSVAVSNQLLNLSENIFWKKKEYLSLSLSLHIWRGGDLFCVNFSSIM